MKAVIQRVSQASVRVRNQVIGKIDRGLVVLLGVTHGDNEQQAEWLVEKLVHLRIFGDDQGKMNLTVKEIGGSILVVSQFTLYADTRKGNRPSFVKAAEPVLAERLYNHFVAGIKAKGIPVKTGKFGAMMQVSLVNDGPVTVILES